MQDLDTRILAAEQRLIAREARVQRAGRALAVQTREAVRPQRLLWPVAGAAVAVAVLATAWSLFGGRKRRSQGRSQEMEHVPDSASASRASFQPNAGGLLLRVLPLAWPLLPERWRSKVSPATATSVLGFGLPLLGRLVGSGRARQPVVPAGRSAGATSMAVSQGGVLATAPWVDPSRFAGIWHEIARLPATFESRGGGQPITGLQLRGAVMDVVESNVDADGEVHRARGIARVQPGSGGARLQVSVQPLWLRWLPFAWRDRWVLHVDDDASDYRVAVIGSPDRKYLRLWARHRRVSQGQLQFMIAVARDRGFRVERLRYS